MKTQKIIPFFLSLFLLGLPNIFLAQQIDRLPSELWRNHSRYYEGKQEIDRDVFERRLEQHPQAGPIFLQSKRKKSGGTVLIIVGSATTIGGIATMLGEVADDVSSSIFTGEPSRRSKPGGTITLLGLGSLAVGAALVSTGNKKMRQAVNTYNEAEVGIDRLSWYVGPKGVGIRLQIGR